MKDLIKIIRLYNKIRAYGQITYVTEIDSVNDIFQIEPSIITPHPIYIKDSIELKEIQEVFVLL